MGVREYLPVLRVEAERRAGRVQRCAAEGEPAKAGTKPADSGGRVGGRAETQCVEAVDGS